MVVDPTAFIARAPDVSGVEIDGEVVLMNFQTGKYLGLDGVASEVWRRLAAPVRVDALCAGLCAHFEGDPATIEREVLAFIGRLAELKLIRNG